MDDMHPPETPMTQRLTNDDFRKLLQTPRGSSSGATGSIRDAMAKSKYFILFT